jgi:hypothetical protein
MKAYGGVAVKYKNVIELQPTLQYMECILPVASEQIFLLSEDNVPILLHQIWSQLPLKSQISMTVQITWMRCKYCKKSAAAGRDESGWSVQTDGAPMTWSSGGSWLRNMWKLSDTRSKAEVVCSFEMSVQTYQTMWCHNPEAEFQQTFLLSEDWSALKSNTTALCSHNAVIKN